MRVILRRNKRISL